jgi:hypothetical protein
MMIRAPVIAESIVASTLVPPAFSHSLGQKQTFRRRQVCPLYTRKQTSSRARGMSADSQNQTLIDGRNKLELGESIWIIVGVAAALPDSSVILIAGVGRLVAGAMSMAASMTERVR